MQGVALHAGAHAAGEVAEHVLVFVLDAAADRHHVAGPAVLGVDRGHDVVEEGPLHEVGIGRVGDELEQPAGELQHVVDVAGLGRPVAGVLAEMVWFAEIFVLAVASGGEGVVAGDPFEEERRRGEVRRVPRIGEAVEGADDLGDLGVAVLPGQVVLEVEERGDEGLVFELAGQGEPAAVAGVGVEVDHDLVHPAELRGQHGLDLGLGQV